jgi:hypothetical protein
MQYFRQPLRGVLPQRRTFNTRRLLPAIVLSAALAAGALILVPGSSEGSTQDHNRLSAYVVATNRGPLPRCSDDGSDCTPANFVWEFIHVVNANPLENQGGTRATVPNAFVVTSVDEAAFVDGVDVGSGTLTPPPNAIRRGVSGHWPATVTCPAPPDACNIVGSPAVLPGENTVIVYDGWFHGQSDPNGVLVFRYTVHGTLNGNPVDLTASSPPIREID